MADASDLFNAADRLLQVAVATLDTQLPPLGLKGAPPRAYVSPGLPAFDCTQLTVDVRLLSEELTSPLAPQPATGSRQKVRGRINLVNYVTTIVRCVHVIQGLTPPTEAKMVVDAEQIYADGWAIWVTYFGLAMRNELFGDDKCQIRRMQSSPVVDPSGGFGGWTINLQAELDGYAAEV